MHRFWILIVLALGTPAWGAIERGLYFDPAHDGHGFDLQPVGQRWVMVLYSYDEAGLPEWFLGVLERDEQGVLRGSLDRFDYQVGRTPPQQVTETVGEVSLDDAAECNETAGSAVFDWSLQGASGSWCVRPLFTQGHTPDSDYTGLWFAGGEDQGWGLSLDYTGQPGAGSEAMVLFYYDADGAPRWALGSTPAPGPDASAELFNFLGYCRSCEPQALQVQSAGTLDHQLTVIDGHPGGEIALDLAYPLDPGGRWDRQGAILPLSDPAPGLIPLPDQLDLDRVIAITDVTVVPMAGDDPHMPHHTVVLQDGLVAAVGPSSQVPVPADAVRVDGRDLFLGPGLSEMHLHISFGGQVPAEEAGLLMIANGVTTALNMGDSFQIDVPRVGRRFGLGLEIGPTFYAGQVAYGPPDGADVARTIRNPAEATAYANRIASEGYDYIKLYWGLSPAVIDQFAIESERLDLPLIGHIPTTQNSRSSFLDGQRMAAHAQEPWISFLNRQFDDARLPAAAAEFLEFGVYLTPTLAVFESFTTIYGGDVEAFRELSEREGFIYTSPLVRNGWRNYFNSTSIQGNGQVDGALDPMYAFFLRLTKAFHDAGVPLLIGTDAPGFPGVMSGFGALREMELFELAGIAPADIYKAATVNAGQFVMDTLDEPPFGQVVVGHRADLILTRSDPMAAIDHLKRPLAVMARGRFWSQAFLQTQLDVLATRYGFGKALKGEPYMPAGFDVGLPMCAEDLLGFGSH